MEGVVSIFMWCAAIIFGLALPSIAVWWIMVKVGLLPAPPYQ